MADNAEQTCKFVEHETESASDQIIDLWCEPCYFNTDRQIVAISHCPSCSKLLCQTCDNNHSKLPSTMQHEVFRGADLPKSNADKPIKYTECALHPSNKSDYYCLTHGIQMCDICTKKHQKQCVSRKIPDLCGELCDEDITNFTNDVTSARDVLSEFKSSLLNNISDIEDNYNDLVRELGEIRNQIITKLEQTFADMTEHVQEMFNRLKSDLSKKIHTLSDATDFLDRTSIDARKVMQLTSTEHAFIKIQEIVQKANELIRSIEGSDIHRETIQLSFSPNPEIVSFVSTLTRPGNIKERRLPKPPLTLPKISFPRAQISIIKVKIKKLPSMNIRSIHDQEICRIVGIAEGSRGNVILADSINCNVKLFSSDIALLSTYKLPADPSFIHHVPEPDGKSIMVPTNDRKLQFLDVSEGTISIKRSLSLKFETQACANYKDNFLVVTNSKPVMLKNIDGNGAERWSLSKDTLGRNLFEGPCFLACKMLKGRPVCIVSDSTNETLITCTIDIKFGGVVDIIQLASKKPSALTIDNHGNVYVCYSKTKEIALYSSDMEHSKIILSALALKPDISSILYNGKTDQLLVSYNNSNNLDVFKVSY